MTLPPIVCANCGARYRLPETFKSPRAKCKKCGSVIDVAAQRGDAGTAPAEAAKPAEAAPPERPTRASRTRAGGERSAPTARSRRSAGGSSRPGRSGSSRRRAGAEEKKKGKGMLIGVGLGVVAIGVVGAVLVMGGEQEDGAGATDLAAQSQPAPDPAEQAAAQEAAEQAAAQPAAEEAAALAKAAEEAAAAKAAEATEATEASGDQPPAEPDKPWLAYDIQSVEDVFDPETETEPVPWPDYVTEAERTEIAGLIDDIENGGTRAIAAKTRLKELGHKALAGIINRLREIDYTDSFDTFFAYELNKLIEGVTITINANFQNVELGSTIDLRVAHWNAQTTKAWIRFMDQYPTAEDFDRLIQRIRSRR